MNLLINEPPLQVLPSLALKVGLNSAIFLQQLHFRLLISSNERDGYKWVYKSYDDWREEEFPFWSRDTIKRIVAELERGGFIITTNHYNRLKMDKTKWYRIDYSKLGYATGQNAPSIGATCTDGRGQVAPTDEGKMHPAIPKEIKSIKNNNVEELDMAHQIINYLNDRASKNFRATTSATKRLIKGRLADGYKLEDFKRVIDVKTTQWLHNPEMNKYLRPDTLFNPTKFEGYLNEAPATVKQNKQVVPSSQPPKLDFNAGEDFV